LDIEAIILGDEALYDATAWWRWLAQRLSRFDVSQPFHSLYEKWQTEFLPGVRRGERDRWAALNEFLPTIGLNRAQTGEVIASSQAQYRRLYDHVHPLPGAVETLKQLANQGIRLVMLRQSRDSLYELNRTLQQWGVRQDFDHVLDGLPASSACSQEEFFVGISKLIELPCESVAFVNRNKRDLAAAKKIGFTTISCDGKAGRNTDLSITHIASLIGIALHSPTMRRAG
jgi:phosphoglycolate phosphatase-like HAD superfamily hydrolase